MYPLSSSFGLEPRPRSLGLLPLELLRAPEGSRLVRACLDVENLTVHLTTTAPTAACPLCGCDSRFSRTFDDAGCSSPENVSAVSFLSCCVEHPCPQEHEPGPAVH